jgi:hypothetical protein
MVDAPDAVAGDGSPAMYFWTRHPESYDPVAANQAIVAWTQPGFIIGLAMRPHTHINIADAHTSISTGVISHTAHFHDHADVGEWLLIAQQATYAGNGRVFGSGSVFTQDGTLVSTFAQDSMARGVEDDRSKRGMAPRPPGSEASTEQRPPRGAQRHAPEAGVRARAGRDIPPRRWRWCWWASRCVARRPLHLFAETHLVRRRRDRSTASCSSSSSWSSAPCWRTWVAASVPFLIIGVISRFGTSCSSERNHRAPDQPACSHADRAGSERPDRCSC